MDDVLTDGESEVAADGTGGRGGHRVGAAPKWLDRDKNTLQGKVIALPTKADIDFDIAVHLIVELYSK